MGISKRRLARLGLAAAVLTASIGLTAAEPGTEAQTTEASGGFVEMSDCVVRFHKRAELATDRPGIIVEMPFDEGDTIEEGDLVVRLRDDVAAANLALAQERASSETAVTIAEKEAAAAAVELKSAETANGSLSPGVPNVVPGTIVEKLRLVKEAREEAIIRAREEVSLNTRAAEQAQAELDSHRIHSQQSGLVTRVMKRAGEAVQQGEAILEVVDARTARVEGKLHVADARRLRIGMPVEVRLDFEGADLPIEDEVFRGTIGFIDVSVTDSYHEVRVWAQVENRDGILLENLPARMTIEVGQ